VIPYAPVLYFLVVSSVSVVGLVSVTCYRGAFIQGGGVAGGCCCRSIDCHQSRTSAVFSAAPSNFSLTTPLNFVSTNRTSPPPYVNVGLVKTQRTQLSPSSSCITDGPGFMSERCALARPGTIGTPPVTMIPVRRPTISPILTVGAVQGDGGTANAVCGQTDAWIPMINKNELNTPATKATSGL
jgi:hypothetical protein